MPATAMTTRALAEALVLAEQPVEAGDADVVDALGRVAQDLGGDGGLLGDRDIRGPGGEDGDVPRPAAGGGLDPAEGPGRRVVDGPGDLALIRAQAAGSTRVTSRFEPCLRISRAMQAIWAGVLPRPKTTSGAALASSRWWSILANSRSQ